MIIAVDFDGTLCENAWPEAGEPNMPLIEWLKMHKANGDLIILWTCRQEEHLDTALRFCNSYGLYFDSVNENIPGTAEKFGYNSKKVYADIYIDDKNADKERFGLPYKKGSEAVLERQSFIAERRKARGRSRKFQTTKISDEGEPK